MECMVGEMVGGHSGVNKHDCAFEGGMIGWETEAAECGWEG